MPAANQGLFVTVALRIRSTGLAQEPEGVGERTSSIVKSPLAASATALAIGVLETVVPQTSVAKTFCPPFVPIPLPPRFESYGSSKDPQREILKKLSMWNQSSL